MSDPPRLGVEAAELLLSIAETPGMAISATALDQFPTAGAALIAAGALRSDGFEAAATSQADLDDAVIGLTWSSELSGYAYFSPTAGLVRIDEDRLHRFKLNISWFLQWITGSLSFPRSAHPVCLIPDRLWHLGAVRLGEGKRLQRRATIFFARRLAEPQTIAALLDALRIHSARPGRVILTTTNNLDLAQIIVADTCSILPIKQFGRANIKHFELNLAMVYSATHGLRASTSDPGVQAATDFRVIRIGEREFNFQGDKQRQVVGFLYRRWCDGNGPISVSTMLEELEFSNTRRLRDLFKGHRDWQDLIGINRGACWLRCDELLI